MDFQLEQGFLATADAATLMGAVDLLIACQYTKENLEHRIAYKSDKSAARDSYAFVLRYPGGSLVFDLPGLELDTLPLPLQDVTREVAKRLGVQCGRLLFNIQRYGPGSKPVRAHFDGEFFDFVINSDDGTFTVTRGIRPKQVALLTLKNDADGGGTTLLSGTESSTIVATAGDLLIFDNVNQTHAVQSLTPKSGTAAQGFIRYVIGWRAFEDQCTYIDGGQCAKDITPDAAAQIHRDFMTTVWPVRLRELRRQEPLF